MWILTLIFITSNSRYLGFYQLCENWFGTYLSKEIIFLRLRLSPKRRAGSK